MKILKFEIFYRLLLSFILIVFLGCGSDRADIASVDSDGDGLTDRAEAVLGTSVTNADSDGDGIKAVSYTHLTLPTKA